MRVSARIARGRSRCSHSWPRTEVLGGIRQTSTRGSQGLCPRTPSRGLAAPCTPAELLTVSPRGSPPATPPPARFRPRTPDKPASADRTSTFRPYEWRLGEERRREEGRLTDSGGRTSGGRPGAAEGRAKAGRESWKDE